MSSADEALVEIEVIFPYDLRPYAHLGRIRRRLQEQMPEGAQTIGSRLRGRGARLWGKAADLFHAKAILSDDYRFVEGWIPHT